jgi:hypothetical protein
MLCYYHHSGKRNTSKSNFPYRPPTYTLILINPHTVSLFHSILFGSGKRMCIILMCTADAKKAQGGGF